MNRPRRRRRRGGGGGGGHDFGAFIRDNLHNLEGIGRMQAAIEAVLDLAFNERVVGGAAILGCAVHRLKTSGVPLDAIHHMVDHNFTNIEEITAEIGVQLRRSQIRPVEVPEPVQKGSETGRLPDAEK